MSCVCMRKVCCGAGGTQYVFVYDTVQYRYEGWGRARAVRRLAGPGLDLVALLNDRLRPRNHFMHG